MSTQPKVRVKPQISANKLAEYMVANPTKRRRILIEAKFPNSYGASRYHSARLALDRFAAAGGRDLRIIERAIETIRGINPENDYQATEQEICIESLATILEIWPDFPIGRLEIRSRKGLPSEIIVSNTLVSVRPEFVLVDKFSSNQVLLGGGLLNFSKSARHSEEAAQFAAQLVRWLSEAHWNATGTTAARLCWSIDLPSRQVIRANKAYTLRRQRIRHACAEIAAYWPHLSK